MHYIGRMQYWAYAILGEYNIGRMQYWANTILGKCNIGRMQYWANTILGECDIGRMRFAPTIIPRIRRGVSHTPIYIRPITYAQNYIITTLHVMFFWLVVWFGFRTKT